VGEGESGSKLARSMVVEQAEVSLLSIDAAPDWEINVWEWGGAELWLIAASSWFESVSD